MWDSFVWDNRGMAFDLNKFVETLRWAFTVKNVGYDQGERDSFGKALLSGKDVDGTDTDCSKSTIDVVKYAGGETGAATYTGNMRANFTANGWEWITDLSQRQYGDILLNEKNHVAVYAGGEEVLQASIDENGNTAGGQWGDQTERETALVPYYDYPWDGILRYQGATAAPTGTLSWGIDISDHQSVETAAHPEAEFVIVKVTEGTGYVNPKWEQQALTAWRAGKRVGLYHFARNGSNNADQEASFFLAQIGDWLGYALLCLDWEDAGYMGDVGWARAWLDLVWDATPTRPLIYMSASTATAYDWSSVAAYYQLWCAGYSGDSWDADFPYDSSVTAAGWDYAIWQYSDSNGLDKNTGYFPMSEWDKAVNSRSKLDYYGGAAGSQAPRRESGAWIPDSELPTPPAGVQVDGYGLIPVTGVWDLWTVRRQARVFGTWGRNEREGYINLQHFLNRAVSGEHIRMLTGASQLEPDGVCGENTTRVLQFFLWNALPGGHVWRTWCNGWDIQDFVDGVWRQATTAVYQEALNQSWGNSFKLLHP